MYIKKIQILGNKIYFLDGIKLCKCNILTRILEESVKISYPGILTSFLISPNEKKIIVIGYNSSRELDDVDGTIRIKYSSSGMSGLQKVFKGEKIKFRILKAFDYSDCFNVKMLTHEGTIAIEYTKYFCRVVEVYIINGNKLDLKLHSIFPVPSEARSFLCSKRNR